MFRGTPCTFFGKFSGKTTETDDLKNNGAKDNLKKIIFIYKIVYFIKIFTELLLFFGFSGEQDLKKSFYFTCSFQNIKHVYFQLTTVRNLYCHFL